MNDYNITSAEYSTGINGDNENVIAVMNGETVHVPMDTANRHYQAILDWVAEGNTIADAD